MAILQGARITGSIIATEFIKASSFSGSLTASRLYVQGSVGIGTTAPVSKLHIVDTEATITLQGNQLSGTRYNRLRFANQPGTINEEIYAGYYGVGGLYIADYSNVGLFFGVSSTPGTFTERVRIANDGNVGIGTSSPTINGGGLHVYGSGQKGIRISGNSSNSYSVEIGCDTTKMSFIQTVGTADRGLQFYTGNASTLLMTLTGSNVGIGTTNPAYKLDVNGNANFTNGFYTNTDASSTSYFVGANGTRPIIFQNNTAASYDFGFKFSDSNTFTIVGGNTLANPTTDLVSFTYDGKVGIGTTNPAYKLDVGGTARVGDTFLITTATTADARLEVGSGRSGNGNAYVDLVGDATYTDYGLRLIRSNGGANTTSAIAHRGTGTLYITAVEAGSISLETTNTTRMTIASGGNVGIGTTSPSATLTVITSNNTGSRIQLGTVSTSTFMDANKVNDFMVLTAPFGNNPASVSNAGAKWGIKMNGSIDNINTKGKAACIYAVSEDGAGYNRTVGMALHTSGFDLDSTERVRINSSGNVGIGTTKPTGSLHVYKAAGTSETTTLTIQEGSGGAAELIFRSGNASTNRRGSLRFFSNQISATTAQWTIGASMSQSSGDSSFYFYNASVDSVLTLTQTNIGIGTTSPAYKLDVAGSVYSSNYFSVLTAATYGPSDNSAAMQVFGSTGSGGLTNTIKFVTGGSERVRINSSGNVGIGTSITFAKFVVSNGSGENIEFTPGNATVNGGLIESINRSTGTTRPDLNLFTSGTSNGSIKFYTNGVNERMRVNFDGNVGIGTSSPAYTLDVVGPTVSITNQPGIISRFTRTVDGRALLRVVNLDTNPTAAATHAGVSFVAYSNVSNRPLTNTHEAQIMLAGTGTGTNDLKFIAPQGMTFWVSGSNVNMTGSAYANYGSQAIAITAGRLVGIGTSSPGYKLHVFSTGNNEVQFETSGTAVSATNRLRFKNASGASDVRTGVIEWYDVNTFKGDIRLLKAGGIQVRNSSDTPTITLDDTGKLGIGTTSPVNKLHISGSSTNLPLKLEGLTSNATGYFLTVDNTTGVVYKSTGGVNGTSGTSGANGSPGSPGSSGTNGTSGTSGANGSPGSPGSSGTNGTSGTSGANGNPGTSGTSGANGNAGSSGITGTSGTSGVTNIKAWIHFNGTGTPSSNASNNVSSITDNGTGDYTINFTTAFSDANYVVAGTATYQYENPGQSINNMFIAVPRRPTAQLAGSCRISTPGSDNVLYDCDYVRVLFSN
jgi:hypothetical protein